MQAIDSAAEQISSGRSDLVLAGGCEAMSHAPLLLKADMVGWLASWQKQRGFIGRSKQLARLKPAMQEIIPLKLQTVAELLFQHL